jgi:hypothetical protein
VAADETAPTRYRFGPLERRGLVAGWRGGQISAVALALVVGVVVLRASASALGIVLALVALAIGVGIATWPIAGRTVEEWAPHALRHAGTVGRRRRRDRTSPFTGIHLVEADLGKGSAGILHDRARRTFTAVLGASAPGFVLLGADDKARRVQAWSGVLASLARDNSAVHRVQWIERVGPAPEIEPAHEIEPGHRLGSTELVASGEHTDGTAPGGGPDETSRWNGARASYDALVAAEAHGCLRHEVFLAVTIRDGHTARAVKAAGGGHAGACAVLLREVAALRRRLADASIDAGPVLSPGALGAVIRGAYEHRPPRPGRTEERRPWPMGAAAEWSHLRADGTLHVTYWVAEWPRTHAGPDFLAPLLLPSEVRRTMSVVMEPLGPLKASRKVEQARTADIADAELRRRGGFLSTARRRREEELLVGREFELADGHAQYRFSGYVTVSAVDHSVLEEECGRVEQSAGQAGLELRRCYGDQAVAFTCTLPLGRGLS